MDPEDFQKLLQFFKALADESRLRILGVLAQRERSVEELAALLGLKEPTVSHHLNKLKRLGLVSMRAEGNVHLYRLDTTTLTQMSKDLFTPEQMASLAEDLEGEAWERRVLEHFLDGERLREIPQSRKKRVVILKWLARQFQPGIRYPEPEVNAIIKRHHPDAATLRRELIGHRLMARENGIYWRLPEGEDERRGG